MTFLYNKYFNHGIDKQFFLRCLSVTVFIFVIPQISYAENTARINKLIQLANDFKSPTTMFLVAKEYEKGKSPADFKHAFSWYSQAATLGHNKSNLKIAFMYKNGIGVTKNTKKAITFFHRAAKKNKNGGSGNSHAQFELGKIFYKGINVKNNFSTAFKWYKKAADQYFYKAFYPLGLMYYEGYGTRKNIEESKKWLAQAIEAGDRPAERLLEKIEATNNRQILLNKIVATDDKIEKENHISMIISNKKEKRETNEPPLTAIDHKPSTINDLTKAATLGKADSQFKLALLKLDDHNNVAAIKLLKSAAEQGHIKATNELINLHLQDELNGVESSKIDTWIKNAAKNENREAQYLLGKNFTNGSSDRVNHEKALLWFKKAATNNHPGAQFSVGKYLQKGLGIPKNLKSAFGWYLKSAQQGLVEAQYAVGEMYNTGKGVPRNRSEAKKWYRLAARQGHYKAKIKARSM